MALGISVNQLRAISSDSGHFSRRGGCVQAQTTLQRDENREKKRKPQRVPRFSFFDSRSAPDEGDEATPAVRRQRERTRSGERTSWVVPKRRAENAALSQSEKRASAFRAQESTKRERRPKRNLLSERACVAKGGLRQMMAGVHTSHLPAPLLSEDSTLPMCQML